MSFGNFLYDFCKFSQFYVSFPRYDIAKTRKIIWKVDDKGSWKFATIMRATKICLRLRYCEGCWKFTRIEGKKRLKIFFFFAKKRKILFFSLSLLTFHLQLAHTFFYCTVNNNKQSTFSFHTLLNNIKSKNSI